MSDPHIVKREPVEEALIILQEECAEVSQAVSKALRFGIDDTHPGMDRTNRELITIECGHVVALIQKLISLNVITKKGVEDAKGNKIVKLWKWSNLPR